MNISDWISIGSFLLAAMACVWGGLFRFSGLEHQVNALGEKFDILSNNLSGRMQKLENNMQRLEDKMDIRFEKLENKIEGVRLEVHRIDVRLTRVEEIVGPMASSFNQKPPHD